MIKPILKISFLSLKSNFILIGLSIVIGVILYVIDISMLMILFLEFIPLPREGKYKVGSKEASSYMLRSSLYQIVISDPFFKFFLSDIFLSNIFFRMLGMKAKGIFAIGENTTRILDPWYTKVGKRVIISGGCLVSCHAIEGEFLTLVKIKIGDNAQIGYGTVIGPGAEIGKNAIIGAYSKVTKFKKIPDNEIWGGFPLRKIK
jgi:hypothetical protein